jgi:hypothetical protein
MTTIPSTEGRDLDLDSKSVLVELRELTQQNTDLSTRLTRATLDCTVYPAESDCPFFRQHRVKHR